MADDHPAPGSGSPKPTPPRPADSSQAHGPAAAHPPRREEERESPAKGMLKEAITKVMEEIEFHEREAHKHRQQAEALKRDLRESFAFMQEQKARGKAPEPPAEKPAEPKKKPGPTKGKKG